MTTTPQHLPGDADIIDMSDEQLMLDPFGGYSRIREQTPLVRATMPGVDRSFWIATRYDDIKMVLSDPRFVVNSANVPGMQVPSLRRQMLRGVHAVPPEYVKYRDEQMGAHDGAENIRLRTLVSPSFTRHKISKLRTRISEITEELLDRLPGHAENGVVDLLRHFGYPLPGQVLRELVGIPERDREQWDEWYTATWSVKSTNKAEAWGKLVPYIQALIERYRAEPTDNLTSGLIRAQTEDGDRLTDTEMIALIVSVGLAGKQTTADLIASGTVALQEHPDQLALLRENPELMPRAVHELLRYCSPTHVARMRYATEDIEVGGVLVRKGEAVRPALVSGNFDPRKFDRPERLDISRAPDGRLENHLSFSHGAHYCLGAALARLEGEIAFEALLRRFPDLSLAIDPADLEYELMPGQWRILKALPVRLGG